ncbi:YfbM family protein [Bacillus sp. EB01]|uniref:YfbM family protein n=1 Tax=Bacillus sp. EB01 TaxID=1347086 RepID=UPI001E3CD5B9|nr:YfbM family protein [Bacillus sp. EB01]
MIASFYRIQPELLNEIKANPDDIYDIFDNSDDIQELELDIDTSWHGIYFLLTGDTPKDQVPDNIGKAILGGTEIGDDFSGNGPARYFEPNEVAQLYSELKQIPASQLAERYDIQTLNENNIYPMGKRWSADDKEFLIENYDFLVNYYKTAAENNQAMLLVIS